MTYTEAVERARKGDAEGFEFLYHSTKNNKYYLALRYVKNEETAKDVLQDAYIRAWKNLDKLKEPEKFEAWLSQIVVNTAKNELEKRSHTPLDLRAESGGEEEDTELFDRTVSAWENVPELEYTKEETRQLVHELIDSLSDEQRLVVIAFELDGMTTKEIAEQLGCSEATVKSRLRYGRNNIKEKAEVLQRKGYKLYSIAPVALFVYLLRKEMVVYAAEPAVQLALAECGKQACQAMAQNAVTAAEAAGNAAVAGKTAAAAKRIAFLSTKAGKTVAGIVLTAAVAGGTAAGIVSYNNTAADAVSQEEAKEQEVQQEQEQAESSEPSESGEASAAEEGSGVEEAVNTAMTEAVGQNTVLHDEVGWSEKYSMILQHVQDNSLISVSEVGLYGFEKGIYENLAESGEKFEYALVDLDKDDIPELLIRANTSETSYDGMSYWMMATYQKSVVDGSYKEMPIMVRNGRYPIIEGNVSIGGLDIYVMMNEEMTEFFRIHTNLVNGDTYTYRGCMEYDTGCYWWKEEEVGYYTYEQADALEEAKKAYPVEIPWKAIDEPLAW